VIAFVKRVFYNLLYVLEMVYKPRKSGVDKHCQRGKLWGVDIYPGALLINSFCRLDVCKCGRYLRRCAGADIPKYLEKVLWLASLVSAALGLLGVVELIRSLALGLILGAAAELLGD
jgi:hypothetical protein